MRTFARAGGTGALSGLGGNDAIAGGGIHAVGFQGSMSRYAPSRTGSTIVVEADGASDPLGGVECFRFAVRTIAAGGRGMV